MGTDNERGNPMADSGQILEIYSTGPMTVLGFGGRDILDRVDIGACRNEIVALVKQHGTKKLAFDLTGVKLVPSGMLGLLASLRQLNVEVHLCNPSDDVREVLEVTNLDRILQVYDIELEKDG
jgi:anti-anti-sigma factor